MKKIMTLFLLICLSLFATGCNNEEVNEKIVMEEMNKLSSTKKIIIASCDNSSKKKKIDATITDPNKVGEFLDIIVPENKPKNKEKITEAGTGTDTCLEMYDENDELIDVLLAWVWSTYESVKSKNNIINYSIVPKDGVNLKTIFEEVLDFKYLWFYAVDEQDEKLVLAYEDDDYNYYFRSMQQIVYLLAIDKKMTMQEALDNNYLTIDDLRKNYNYIFKAEKKYNYCFLDNSLK